MGYITTVTSKSMVNIPVKIRRKYGLIPGSRVVFVESEDGITLIPVPPATELFGAGRNHKRLLLQGIRELEAEHRSEASE